MSNNGKNNTQQRKKNCKKQANKCNCLWLMYTDMIHWQFCFWKWWDMRLLCLHIYACIRCLCMCDMYDYVMLMFQEQRKCRTHWMLDRPDSCSAFAMLMRQRYVVDLCHSAITKVKILCKNKVTKIAVQWSFMWLITIISFWLFWKHCINVGPYCLTGTFWRNYLMWYI